MLGAALETADSTAEGRTHAFAVRLSQWPMGHRTRNTYTRGQTFYERGIGAITNGRDVGGRPSALYLTTNIPSTGVESGWEGAGWVEASYGVSGNVTSFTVHGQCTDAPSAGVCADLTGTLSERLDNLRANCACADEQHYSFRWDELNRLVDGRRHDRAGPSAPWTPAARMRYRYDGANQRTVKESFAEASVSLPERYTLYVYPGDFERRGLTITFDNDGLVYQATEGSGPDATETQYLIAGARIVWDAAPSITGPGIDRNRRATVNVTDLLGTTAASLDLLSGALLEVSTYYPNGARENLWTNEADVPLEPIGFTGKEADEEIGVTYFGERWLIPRLGRWATPDPLHVHAAGGGEALNSYHYVSGNLLQARDPIGLTCEDSTDQDCDDQVDESPPSGPTGRQEDWTPLDGVFFEEGTRAAAAGLNEAEWGIATTQSADGGTRDDLYYRTRSRGGRLSERTRYDPYEARWGRDSVSHDPWGQAVIDFAMTVGIGAVAESTADLGADASAGRLLSAAGPRVTRASLVRAIRTTAGAWRFEAARRISGAGLWLSRHSSGLTSSIRTGVGGRIEQVHATLSQAYLRSGTAVTSAGRTVVEDTTDDAGHIVGRLLGGGGGANSGNLMSQLSQVNRGAFAQFERTLAQAVERGESVSVNIRLLYGTSATRPDFIVYNASPPGILQHMKHATLVYTARLLRGFGFRCNPSRPAPGVVS